jgi:CHAD domain-containing protein
MRTDDLRTADVLLHLGDSLRRQWRRYRRRLEQCQKHYSEKAVHASRVETRRLLATVELLRAFIAEDDIKKARRVLKHHLDTFDQLRDTQVQLAYVGRLARRFAVARRFQLWLAEREARFARETRKAIKQVKTGRLGRRVAAFEEEINRLREHLPRDRAFRTALKEIDQAFARVAHLRRRVRAEDTRTIHRTRIAFKRFRYMVEALALLLPDISDQHCRALRGYQSMMGNIQDVEVLLAALEEFVCSRTMDNRPALRLRDELLRRRQRLIRVYLNAADNLRQFWPLPAVGNPMRAANFYGCTSG